MASVDLQVLSAEGWGQRQMDVGVGKKVVTEFECGKKKKSYEKKVVISPSIYAYSVQRYLHEDTSSSHQL